MTKDLPQHEIARQWRERTGWSRAELAQRIGYSVSSISDYESGRSRSSGNEIGDNEWLRYRLACAAVAAHVQFDWTSCRIVLDAAQP
jgi:transcriptional regulator with XRE-family HTH domain